jgi:hypothetical protein
MTAGHDILLANGHVYPEVNQLKTEAGYAQRKLLYRNLRNGKFEDISGEVGPGISMPVAARGCAFGDFDNDGDIDVVVNCVNASPQLLRSDASAPRNWIKVKLVGTQSNRSGIGARITCHSSAPDEAKPHRQIDEVRSGGSYFSQNDLRVHFGLAGAAKVDHLEVRWLSGTIDTLKEIAANQLVVIKKGQGAVRTEKFADARSLTSTSRLRSGRQRAEA